MTLTTVSNSFVSNNNCENCWGGGIEAGGGTLTVAKSIFSGNAAGAGGGGIASGGPLTVTNSVFSGNLAGGGGGGIYSGDPLMVTNSAFFNNSSDGIFNASRGNISNSSFSGNGGSGIANQGTLVVSNSAFSDNSSYGSSGGIDNQGSLVVSNSTFSGNSATGTYGRGGGLRNGIGTVTVSNSTFSDNSATNGGGIFNESGTVVLKNAIVANSPTGGNCSGNITDGGGNLSYPDTTCPGINADPVLGPLQDNGGPTWTMALGPGSAAIDAADDAICAAEPVNNLDQRGVTRPQGAHCDIGALEQILDPTAVSLAALSAGSVPGAIPPTVVFGLLLLALLGFGASRRGRQTRLG